MIALVVGGGPFATAKPEPEAGLQLAWVDEAAGSPATGAVALGSAPLQTVGGRSMAGRVGRPCTPRRQAIQTLADVEEGGEVLPEAPVEMAEAAPAYVVPLGAGAPVGFGPGGVPIGGGPGGTGPGFGGGPPSGGGPFVPGGPGVPPTTLLPPPTSAIPEPGTWTVMIVGFGVVGALLRGRAKAATL